MSIKVKQPNGKYAIVEGWRGELNINIDKEEYIAQIMEKFREQLEEQFKEADEKSRENLPEIYEAMINEGLRGEELKAKFEAMGYDFEIIKRNVRVEIKSDSFSSHDCCSYGKCPVCGATVDSWSRECGCGQKIFFK